MESALAVATRRIGRRDNDGQEKIVSTKPYRDREADGVALYKKKQEAAAQFSDWCKAVAEQCNANAPAIRRRVMAEASNKLAELRRDANQLVLFCEPEPVTTLTPAEGTQQ